MDKTTRAKTGGRQAGTCNRNSLTIRLGAAAHADEAIALLARLMTDGENDAIKLSAAREILDRAGGKTVDSELIIKFENREIYAEKQAEDLRTGKGAV